MKRLCSVLLMCLLLLCVGCKDAEDVVAKGGATVVVDEISASSFTRLKELKVNNSKLIITESFTTPLRNGDGEKLKVHFKFDINRNDFDHFVNKGMTRKEIMTGLSEASGVDSKSFELSDCVLPPLIQFRD